MFLWVSTTLASVLIYHSLAQSLVVVERKTAISSYQKRFRFMSTQQDAFSDSEKTALVSAMNNEQRKIFNERIEQFEIALSGIDGSLWFDGIGVYYPPSLLDAWERAIYRSLTDLEIQEIISHEWKIALKVKKISNETYAGLIEN